MDVAGSVAVVTGASAGIGWATARALAREGATVVASARRIERLEELVGAIQGAGGDALAIPCDVSEWSQVQALAGRVRDTYGRCDILVNNAGVPGGGSFAELSLEQIERVVRTNYLGVLYGTKAFLPMMLAAGKGHVVNVASLAGRFAVPGASVYSSTKHAVVAFSEALYYELEPRGVLVTTVNPGLVATETFPHRDAIERGRRVMKPEDVSRAILEVVKRGIAPERSVPRWLASLQAFRLLAPPLYKFGLRQVVKRAMKPTLSRHPDPSDLRRDGEEAFTSLVQNEVKKRGPVITYAFSRNPRDDFVEVIKEAAEADDRIRLAAVLRPDSHSYQAFLILYVTTRKEGRDLAHDLLGTQVSHENKMGTRGLKTM